MFNSLSLIVIKLKPTVMHACPNEIQRKIVVEQGVCDNIKRDANW